MIKLNRRLPVNLNPADADLFAKELSKEIPGARIIPFKNIFLISDGICYRNFKVVDESLISPGSKYFNLKRYLLKNLFHLNYSRLPSGQTYVLAHDIWSYGYFHWMTDTLQRLFAAKNTMENCRFLLPQLYRNEYHSVALEALGIKNIEWLKNTGIYFIKNLHMSAHVAVTGNNDPALIRGISQSLIQHVKKDLSLGDRIYVSRARAAKRKVLNEEEVIYSLSKSGFKVVCFEDYSYKDQVSISNSARHFISIHGGGLTNVMFMRPGGNVLELRRGHDRITNSNNNCFFSLASDMELNYYYQLCESPNENLSTQDGDLIVNIDVLEKNVKLMLENSAM